MKNVSSIKEFSDLLTNESILLAYFGTDSCSVCHATKPKVDILMKKFPDVLTCYCPADHVPELSGQYLIFTVPAVIIFHMGREIFRSARFIDLVEVEKRLKEMSENNENVFEKSKKQ